MTHTSSWEKKVREIADYLGCNEGELWSEMSKLLSQAVAEERERLFKNPLELFRGNRIKMTREAREALLMAIDITHPKDTEGDNSK